MRRVLPAYEEAAVGWLEEPFPPHDFRNYVEAASIGDVPLAAGENHFTRFQARQLLEADCVDILQPDPCKCGGITEAKKIADLGERHDALPERSRGSR